MVADAFRRRPGLSMAAVLLTYAALSMALFCRTPHWRRYFLGNSGGDPWTSIWSLAWWPWAVLHGQDAIHTRFVYAPDGYDLTWATSAPTAALLAAPVTLIFGAAVSYNALSILAPALAASSAFLLIRESTGCGIASSVVCGALFGFSSYEIGQMQGHLNLDLDFPVPLVCWLCVARVRGRIGRAAFIGWAALLLLAEFGLSVEVFASLVSLGLFAWLAFVLFADRQLRRTLARLCAELAAALVLVAIAATPWLAHMALSRTDIPDFVNLPSTYSTNLYNLVIPTPLTAVGGRWLAGLSSQFSGNLSEQGGYLGAPLLAALVLLAWERGRERVVAALLVVAAGLFVASLGPSLHAGRWDSGIPLPWWVATHLPLLRAAMPARFSLYVALAASVAAALWQNTPASARARRLRLLALTVSLVMLLPDPSSVQWRRLPLLPFFAPAQARAALGTDATVLVLPYLAGTDGPTPSMLWQWQSGMSFRQAGGYLPFLPVSISRAQFAWHLARNEPSVSFASDLAAFAFDHGISHVAAGPGVSGALLSGLRSLGWRSRQVGGVDLFDVPPRAALRFASLAGDVWTAWDNWSWMGTSISVTTQNQPAIVHLSDGILPTPATVLTMQVRGGATRLFNVAAHGSADIAVPSNATVTISSGATFVPRLSWPGTQDNRRLSFLVSVEPVGAQPRP